MVDVPPARVLGQGGLDQDMMTIVSNRLALSSIAFLPVVRRWTKDGPAHAASWEHSGAASWWVLLTGSGLDAVVCHDIHSQQDWSTVGSPHQDANAHLFEKSVPALGSHTASEIRWSPARPGKDNLDNVEATTNYCTSRMPCSSSLSEWTGRARIGMSSAVCVIYSVSLAIVSKSVVA